MRSSFMYVTWVHPLRSPRPPTCPIFTPGPFILDNRNPTGYASVANNCTIALLARESPPNAQGGVTSAVSKLARAWVACDVSRCHSSLSLDAMVGQHSLEVLHVGFLGQMTTKQWPRVMMVSMAYLLRPIHGKRYWRATVHMQVQGIAIVLDEPDLTEMPLLPHSAVPWSGRDGLTS
ncbi:hypothetical protein BC826DRAFT_344661 [Russula brevipes]|nr:hypothetical protein BC826DRAFT_344661 [Russula brevipes]